MNKFLTKRLGFFWLCGVCASLLGFSAASHAQSMDTISLPSVTVFAMGGDPQLTGTATDCGVLAVDFVAGMGSAATVPAVDAADPSMGCNTADLFTNSVLAPTVLVGGGTLAVGDQITGIEFDVLLHNSGISGSGGAMGATFANQDLSLIHI